MQNNFASWVLSHVDYNQDSPILIDASDPDKTLSFNQLRSQVQRLIAGLQAVGVRPGDCVCVNAFNSISYSVLYLGVIGAGAVFSGVNPSYSLHELVHHIKMVDAKLIVAEPSTQEKTLEAANSCDLPTSSVYAFNCHNNVTRDDVRSWLSLLQYGEAYFESCSNPDVTVAAYQTSSGTSGLPKAAMIPHSYLISQAQLRMADENIDYRVSRLTALPPMHAFATPIIPASIRQGYPTYIMRRYNEADFIAAIERHQITETYLPPPPVISIPKSRLATQKALESLRQVWWGGASVSYQNQTPFQKLLHEDGRLYPLWGMTELGWISSRTWPEKHQGDSVGRPFKDFEVRVVDDDGHIIRKSNISGELQIRAPYPMLGYIANPNADREVFGDDKDGRWVKSGDVGYIDEEGLIFIVDRKKDLIKVRGWQVSPAEVEGCIQQHPEVVDVGVIGVPDPIGTDEIVRAYIVRRCDSNLTRLDVSKHLAVILAGFKCPKEFIFTDFIPRNPTGKILRRLLREDIL
ncbi:amp dependent CoA ligase [Amniculicola lignicola CBS 123094]|uniref:Amp dependent CoA ligase n=1 Tax=Amniculicola lignicola CBS 123094 TaxID=1392246 RepID=A0A6A5W0Z2_9PLEO|nr:amp dependent CoA ligase [Amniculicola lignicola CBS 123094]